MIKNIIAASMFVFCLIAIALSLNGVTHAELSKPFIDLVNSTNHELNSYNISIPDIPKIPIPDFITANDYSWYEIIGVLSNILKGIIDFFNIIITLLNFIVLALNTIINLLAFVFILLKNVIIFRDTLIA